MGLLNVKKPVEVIYPDDWTLPVIFSSPHSGDYYPDSFVRQSNLDLLSLRQSEDYKVDELIGTAPRHGAPMVKSNYPRAFCDPNRQAYELDPSMFDEDLPEHVTTSSHRIAAGIGTIPKIVSAGKQIHTSLLTYQDALERLMICYFPYHAALKELIDDGVEKFGQILLVDCHSMPGSPANISDESKLTDFILGDRFGDACSLEYSIFIANKLKSYGYSVCYNSPYAGGYITQHYSRNFKNVNVLQIEINRHLYMDQSTLTPTEGMTALKDQLSELIMDLNTIFKLKKTV